MEKVYQYNNSTVRVVFGSIMDTDAEVIVCSNDNRMTMSGTVAKAICVNFSDGISTESHKLMPVALGDVAVTSAIGMPQKYIFHAITHEIDPDGKNLQQHHIDDDIQCYIIEHSVKKCFQLMRMLNVSTIAFPTIGTGKADIPFSKVAKCMAKVISKSLLATNKAMKVEVYLHDISMNMTNFDYLPIFEWFASYSLVAKRELEQEVETSYMSTPTEAPDVEIIDCSQDSRCAHRVFISYSRKDADTVRGICGILNDINIPYWIDINGIYSGENYKEMIVQAISESDLVLFVSSANSNQSSHVAKEIGIADKYNRVIIPVKIDNSPFNPKMEYDLNGIDTIDFLQPDEKRVRKLKNAVLAHIAMTNKA